MNLFSRITLPICQKFGKYFKAGIMNLCTTDLWKKNGHQKSHATVPLKTDFVTKSKQNFRHTMRVCFLSSPNRYVDFIKNTRDMWMIWIFAYH